MGYLGVYVINLGTLWDICGTYVGSVGNSRAVWVLASEPKPFSNGFGDFRTVLGHFKGFLY